MKKYINELYIDKEKLTKLNNKDYYNKIINKQYDKLNFNFNNINGYVNIQIDNNKLCIFINNNKIIKINNCCITEINIRFCNLINNNKLNLEIKNCNNLKEILFDCFNRLDENNFKNLKLNISNCNSFNYFSFCSFKNTNKLNQILDIIYNLNLSFNKLYFYFYDCKINNEFKYYNNIENIILRYISDINLKNFINLKYLKIINCSNINKIPNNLIKLKYLYLKVGYNIKEIPNNLINLNYLYLKECYNIKEIPNNLINLKKLNIYSCYNIKNIPDTFINLKQLKLINCKNIKEIPILINLKKLIIDKNIIPNTLINLKELYICYNELINIPNTLINLKKLKIEEETGHIDDKVKIKIPNTLINLENLIIKKDYFYDEDFLVNLPKTLIKLKKLYLENCSEINDIPNTFINLKELKIKDENDINRTLNINNKYINLSKLIIDYIIDFSVFNGGYSIGDGFLKINIKDKDKINNYINKTKGNLFYNIKKIRNEFNIFNLIKYDNKKEIFYNTCTKKYFTVFN